MAAPHAPVRALVLAAAAAMALHALLLASWGGLPLQTAPGAPGAPAGLVATAPLVVRQIAYNPAQPQPPSEADATNAEPMLKPAATVKPAPNAAARTPIATDAGPASPPLFDAPEAALKPDPSDAAPSTAAAVAAPAASGAAPPASAQALSPAPADATTPAARTEGAAPPVYRTQPAPPATLLFDLKRGLISGQAVLTWRPDGADSAGKRYTLALQAQAFGIDAAGWASTGRFDEAGLAPERYAETRRSRVVRATNFQRAADKISFSAQATEFPLVAGVQDRSSWMLQLGAILQANPELAQPGAQVTMVVVGTRGAPEPWVFTVVERVALAMGSANETPTTLADTVHLTREPRHPYDTRASVWLDPARYHLPVKVQLLVPTTGEGQVFELRQLTQP